MRGGYMSVEVLPLVGWVYYGGTRKKCAVNSYKIAINGVTKIIQRLYLLFSIT